METRKSPVLKGGMRWAMFLLAWILLGWPVVSLAEDDSGLTALVYLSAVGFVVVVFQYLAAWLSRDGADEDNR